MSDDANQTREASDQSIEKSGVKTSQQSAEAGVIGGQKNQDIHGQAFAVSHANDLRPSDPSLVATKDGETLEEYRARVAAIKNNPFVLIDSPAQAQNEVEGSVYKVFELEAKQAVNAMPTPSPELLEGPYNSSVKLNIQVTNVPEVSDGIRPEEALQYLNQAFESGAQAVRPVEKWLATPNAVNDSLLNIGSALDSAVDYFANHTGDQIKSDTQTTFSQVVDAAEHTLSYPHSQSERAQVAGKLMPFFFVEGNVKEQIQPETVQQLGLDGLSETELSAIGIRRLTAEASDLHMPQVPENLKHLELQPIPDNLVRAVEGKGRTVTFGEPGSMHAMRLEAAEAVALTMYPSCTEILIRPDAPRVALLEEFLHGTQAKLGIIEKYELRQMAEVHVKDFMLRHQKLLGLDANDVVLLNELREQELHKLEKLGYRLVQND